MVAHVFLLPHVVHSIFTLFFLLSFVTPTCCEGDQDFSECLKPFHCGLLSNLSYPFWDDSRSEICGFLGLKRRCQEGKRPVISINNEEFYVKSVDQPQHVMTIALWENVCPLDNVSQFPDTSLNETPFSYVPEFENVTLFYNCTNQIKMIPDAYRISCGKNGPRNAFYATDDAPFRGQDLPDCNTSVKVPVPSRELIGGLENLTRVLIEGFNVTYKFNHSCGTDPSPTLFECLCREKPDRAGCPKDKQWNFSPKIFVGVTCGVIGFLVACACICRSKKIPSVTSIFPFQKMVKNNQDFEDFLKNHGPLAIKRYNFSEVKKMTSLFKDKLGQGGYGSVYKGKLFDGRLVAVKLLNASKGDGQEFINEVASISRTSHVNVVTILGFCLEGKKRALIYEFMSNGSLEKFICHGSTFKIDQHLGWETMHQIAIGIARGLEYLHRGCNTRIVHFDIKPHNILLDENFCPKISDFGLAKLCTKKESTISMLEARGTVGYIAPEVFSRNFGRVSSKSDVYSYGMMVLEMVGGMEEDDEVGTDNSSEKYFPQCIYRRLEQGNNYELLGEISIEEIEIVRKLTMVGLWCIQTIPSHRPSMSKVIEMLQGSIETLNIPPKPSLSCPPPFLASSFTISVA
ncbi:LEAF RUST 10 DISEASE-RESISTANCE LOCUS RECEPTOR-LIKE PROTEIN KINASE-like 2.1 isoform X2 [Hevea brasiliensis]|uniref:LEAF RUST 10 DISEASE-RESISTANCE LOCUS RECEPTOR-LIKE PROTEIN KINASE-like 2.1 isoform X2 n=1 Tax=Hevea brasiliensis TaxID=3981 RepID=UPI0025D0D5AC|nr:LEAF RUST 10 DISEASE-RESISTANCE LOCUS RECEPTOR-LIKE PROTEIN KINASE-like 2.1 isoform X2 [Hevea brasiliensis]